MIAYVELIPFKSAFERLDSTGLLDRGDREFLQELGILKENKGMV